MSYFDLPFGIPFLISVLSSNLNTVNLYFKIFGLGWVFEHGHPEVRKNVFWNFLELRFLIFFFERTRCRYMELKSVCGWKVPRIPRKIKWKRVLDQLGTIFIPGWFYSNIYVLILIVWYSWKLISWSSYL